MLCYKSITRSKIKHSR